MTITITALATLFATILAGILLDKFRNRKAAIVYESRKAVPIKIDNKVVGAYVVSIQNTSKKTIKDVTLSINVATAKMREGGIACTNGLEYQVSGTNQDSLKIEIPYFKSNDKFSITSIGETTHSAFLSDARVTVRSPQDFKLKELDDTSFRKYLYNPWYFAAPIAAVVASFVVGFAGVSTFFLGGTFSQKDILTFAAAINGLPTIAETYATSQGIKYYHQGDMVVALAESKQNRMEAMKYRAFLETTISMAQKRMAKISKCKLYCAMARLAQIAGDEQIAYEDVRKAMLINEKFVRKLASYDKQLERLLQPHN